MAIRGFDRWYLIDPHRRFDLSLVGGWRLRGGTAVGRRMGGGVNRVKRLVRSDQIRSTTAQRRPPPPS